MQALCLCGTSKRAYSHSLILHSLILKFIIYLHYINLMCGVNDEMFLISKKINKLHALVDVFP